MHETHSGPSKKYTCSQFMRKPSITKILERYLLVGKKVLYKFPNDIASQLLTLSWSFENLRLHHILLISEVNSCPIVMFEYSFWSLEPPLQESKLILPLGAYKCPNGANIGDFWHIFAIFECLTGPLVAKLALKWVLKHQNWLRKTVIEPWKHVKYAKVENFTKSLKITHFGVYLFCLISTFLKKIIPITWCYRL